VIVTPAFAGLSQPGVCQINLVVPSGLGTGDVSLVATVGGVQTPAGVVISLQDAANAEFEVAPSAAVRLANPEGAGKLKSSHPRYPTERQN